MAKTKGTYVSVSPLFFCEQIGILFVFERRQNMQIKKDYTREQIVTVAKRCREPMVCRAAAHW